MASWHSDAIDDVFDALDASEGGLDSDAAEQRLAEEGTNEIEQGESVSPIEIFIDQFRDFLIYLLIVAAVFSVVVGEMLDAVLIGLILILNGIFGFIQDYKAEKSIEALKDLSSPDATVLRDGKKKTIDATEVVPGDIVFIEQGDAIPADSRVLEAHSLETDESALTGESVQVTKQPGTVDAETTLAERDNMVYMNTTAVKGRGKAVVTDTGMDTAVGDIATQLEEAEDKQSPFQEEVDELGKKIGYGVMLIIALVAAVQVSEILFGGGVAAVTLDKLVPIALVAIALAVAAVPEGLPAVVTLSLALGSKKMLKKDALVRRLPVVESLGSVDVIATDKTGTLTEDSMTVKRILYGGDVYEVTGTGISTEGTFDKGGEEVDPAELEPLLRAGVDCNNAEKAVDDDEKEFLGDPTEIALLVSAAKAGIDIETERHSWEREREIPFSSARKRMTTINEHDDSHRAYMKGAPEVVLERCDRILIDGEEQELTDEKRQEILDQNQAFAEDALRVLASAYKPVDDIEADEDAIESDMIFLGLQGMIDPPRDEVQEAIEDCRSAGIRVVMATGDNIATAKAIGEQIGFDPTGAMTGKDVEDLSDEELQERVEDVEVFARVSPSHKVRILEALQANGHNVAMTGDGVNDAPALKKSDVGVAMGVRGTDVAKQTSDMILRDDNFVTIRDAIAEGRGIFDNIRKFVNYLLSANAGEVLVMFFGILLASVMFPSVFKGEHALVPILTPVMLLWINVVTDGLPALALGADPKADGIMDRQPRGTDEPVINRRMMASIGGIGLLMAITLLPLFFYRLDVGIGTMPTEELLVRAQTLLFTGMVVFEMVRIQTIRQRYNQSILSNPWLLVAAGSSFLLQLGIVYLPIERYLNALFGMEETITAPLTGTEWGYIAAAFIGFVILVFGMLHLFDRIFED